ncbi:MAG: F0F1 ATP synthase subunit B [Puniceicoccales bacterium]|jgi:F-type H+-transporting ATPase subunit b|nr:F0F1 ATP synthase subunit B [Puniceicoccales bacterium]
MTIGLPVCFASMGADSIFGKFGIDWHLLLIQGVNFLFVTFILYRFAFRPIVKTLDARRAEIEAGLKYASDMKVELENLNSQREKIIGEAKMEASAIMVNAQQQAKDYSAQQQAEVTARLDSMVSRVKAEISAERDAVIEGAKNELKYLVIDVAAKVLEKALSQSDKDNFVNATNGVMQDILYAKKNK